MHKIERDDPLRESSVFYFPAVQPWESKLRQIQALVMLHGPMRHTPLTAGIGRCVLDLPVVADRRRLTILHSWCLHADLFARDFELRRFVIRLVLSQNTRAPDFIPAGDAAVIQFERDRSEYRGTAGVLHDLADEYKDSDYLIVTSGSQLLLDPLNVVMGKLLENDADVILTAQPDGTPSGMMLIRCACLRDVPSEGFHDLNEQVLPRIAHKFNVRVVHGGQFGRPIRTLDNYIAALREFYRRDRRLHAAASALDNHWQPLFSVVEGAAEVHPSATLHDSVVLDGGKVEADAVVVRSVVCPGGVVKRSETVIDRVVAPR